MDWKIGWHFVLWSVVNLGVPYGLPFAAVRVMQHWKLDLTERQRSRLRITYLLKEAQLSLTNVAIAAVALFELKSAPQEVRDSVAAEIIMFALIGLILWNACLFVGGTVIGNPPVEEAVTGKTTLADWKIAYPLGWQSLQLAAGVSLLALAVHVTVYLAEHAAKQSAKVENHPAASAAPSSQPQR